MLLSIFCLHMIYRLCFHQGRNDLFATISNGHFSVFFLLDLFMTSDSVDQLRLCDMTLFQSSLCLPRGFFLVLSIHPSFLPETAFLTQLTPFSIISYNLIYSTTIYLLKIPKSVPPANFSPENKSINSSFYRIPVSSLPISTTNSWAKITSQVYPQTLFPFYKSHHSERHHIPHGHSCQMLPMMHPSSHPFTHQFPSID